ncbi:MAG: DUF2779 domain-containing protein [bacterium]|nr:MAG: DUF2779 domain-containing protein [bacterium]
MLTKSDFLLFLKAPLHLWAKKHKKLDKKTPSAYEQHLMKQGYDVEKLARKLLPHAVWQKPYITDELEIRQDALIKFDDGSANLYEVKSSTEVKKEHLFDLAFQAIATEEKVKLKKVFTVTINKDYVKKGEIDVNAFFVITDLTKQIRELKPVVQEKILDAINVANKESKDYIENCLNPKTCPCINLCYPNLPEKSIFNIPYLNYKKKRELVDMKILDITKIPESIELNEKQKRVVTVISNNKPYLNSQRLKEFLDSFTYPIYFLDYETYSLAIPIYNNYKPYQHMVFQYSLHIVNNDGTVTHKEYLETETGDPSKNLIKKLKKDIGPVGSVVSWNKQFECSRNNDMALLYPEYKEFLEGINNRMIDLADFINKEIYIHPDFFR